MQVALISLPFPLSPRLFRYDLYIVILSQIAWFVKSVFSSRPKRKPKRSTVPNQTNGAVKRTRHKGRLPRRVRLLFYLQKRPCQRQAMVSLLITSWRKADTARRRCRLVSPIPRESPIRRCRPRSAPEYGLRSAPWSGGARW